MKKNKKNIIKILNINLFLIFLFIKGENNLYCNNKISNNNIITMLNLIKNKKIRGFLSVIGICEGTKKDDLEIKGCLNEYKIPFMNKEKINDLTKHPNRLFTAQLRKRQVAASASGKYQFLTKTWNEWEEKCPQADIYTQYNEYFEDFFKNLNKYYGKDIISLYKNKNDLLKYKFGPFWQDFYAIGLLMEVDAINDIINKNYKSLFEKASQKWSTIPYNSSNISRYESFINHSQKYNFVKKLCEKYII